MKDHHRVHRSFRQPTLQRVLFPTVLTVFAGFLAVGGLDDQGWSRYAAWTGAAALMLIGARGLVLRIDATPDGVRFVNWFRSVAYPWDQVAKFGHDDSLWMRARDGREQRSSAFAYNPDVLPFIRTIADGPSLRAARDLEALRQNTRRRQAAAKKRCKKSPPPSPDQ